MMKRNNILLYLLLVVLAIIFINDIPHFIWLIALFITHEFGHYLIAKRDGIYKGWGISPTPHINLTKPFDKKWKYLSGMAFSLITYPLFLLSYPFPSIFEFIGLIIACGAFDILIIINLLRDNR